MSYQYYQQNTTTSPDTQQLRLPAHMQWPAPQTQSSQLPPTAPSPTSWNQQAHQAPQLSEHIPQTSHSQPLQPNQTQMMTMMAMWQQMQQMQQLQAQQQQQQQPFMPPYGVPQPQHQVTDHSQPFASHDQYDQDLAHVLFQSKLRGQDYKTAIETLHMYRGHHADAWKNYFLLNFHRIDGLVTTLHARHAQTVHSNGASNGRAVGANGITPPPIATPPIRYKGQVPRPRSVPNDAQQNQKGNENPTAKRDNGSNIASSSSRPAARPSGSNASHPRRSPPSVLPTTSRRQTLNSLSAPLMTNPIPEQVLINKATGLPRTPSRSPSPPPADAVRKPRGTGTQYIVEDEVYFFRFITWELKRRPELKKSELCEMLEEKVPAHSANSWLSFWRNHEDVADKILFNAQLHESDQPAVLESISSVSPRRARQRAEQRTKKSAGKDRAGSITDSDEDSESSSEPDDDEDSDYGGRRGSRQRARRASSSGSSSDEQDDEKDELSSNNLESSDDGEELGEAGTAFGMPEMRALAKYISSLPEWKYMKGKEKWEPFSEQYPQRTSASWKEYYRRKETEIDQLARKYAKRADKRASVKLQRGRPSWASGNQISSETHGARKRGHSVEDVDRDEKKMRIAEIRRS